MWSPPGADAGYSASKFNPCRNEMSGRASPKSCSALPSPLSTAEFASHPRKLHELACFAVNVVNCLVNSRCHWTAPRSALPSCLRLKSGERSDESDLVPPFLVSIFSPFTYHLILRSLYRRLSWFELGHLDSDQTTMEQTKLVSPQTVLKHNTPEDCWIVVGDEVWDVTNFVPEHPGGAASEYSHCFLVGLSLTSRSHPEVCRP